MKLGFENPEKSTLATTAAVVCAAYPQELCVYFKGIYSEEIKAVDGVNFIMFLGQLTVSDRWTSPSRKVRIWHKESERSQQVALVFEETFCCNVCKVPWWNLCALGSQWCRPSICSATAGLPEVNATLGGSKTLRNLFTGKSTTMSAMVGLTRPTKGAQVALFCD